MAVKGDVGKIMFENAGGTEADISDLRAWSLSVTKDTQETTKMGDTSKSFVGGLISGEGSAELIYDNAGNADYLSFVEDILTTGDAGDALFELFPDSSASAKKFGFSGDPEHHLTIHQTMSAPYHGRQHLTTYGFRKMAAEIKSHIFCLS